MKVLAIRGRNLASLPSFELELNKGPFESTGIFAITGPTGAGKSTILDALCLALYDQIPRLSAVRGTAVGDEQLHASDVRGIMRRGTIDAFAEVDFAGLDGNVYRARWEVWRARRKTSGRVQDQRMHLSRLDPKGEVILTEGTKRDTLRAIAQQLGLGFSEFRRAVLLAQGDFAAFMMARPDERAALLERMTGTELYATLSKAAFVRAKQEAESRAHIAHQISAIRILEDKDRASIEISEVETKQTLHNATVELRHATKIASWYATHQELVDDLQRAEAEYQAAQTAAQDLPQLEAQLTKLELLSRLQPLVRTARQAHLRLNDALRLKEETQTNAHRARDRLRDLIATAKTQEQAQQAAEDRLREHRPTLEKTQVLDGMLTRLLETSTETEQRLALLNDEHSALKTRLTTHNNRISEHEDKLEADKLWREQNPHTDGFPDRGTSIELNLRHLAQLNRDAHSITTKLDEVLGAQAQHRTQLSELQNQFDRAQTALAAASRAAQEVRSTTHGKDRLDIKQADLRTAFNRLAPIASSVRSLRQLCNGHRRRATEIRKLNQELKTSQKKGTQQAELARAQRNEVSRGVAEAKAAKDQLQSIETHSNWSQLRALHLRPEAPCPLCGSTHHPHGYIEDATLNEQLHELRTKAEEAETRRDKALQSAIDTSEDLGKTEERAQMYRQRLEELNASELADNQTLSQLREELASIWLHSAILHRLGLPRVGLLLPLSIPPQRTTLAPALSALEDVEATLEKLAQEDELARNAQLTASEQLNEAKSNVERARSALDTSIERSQNQATRRQELEDYRTELEAKIQALKDELLPQLSNWPDARRIHESPEELADEVRRTSNEIQERANSRLESLARLQELSRRRPELLAELEARSEAILKLQKEYEALQKEYEVLKTKRHTLLGTRTVMEVEAELQHHITTEEQQSEQLRIQTSQAERSLAEAEAEARLRAEGYLDAEHFAQDALNSLTEALEPYPEAERQLLITQAEAPLETRKNLEDRKTELQLRLNTAAATQKDRAQRLERHAQNTPTTTEQDNRQILHDAEGRVEHAREHLTRIRSLLELDDEARTQRNQLRPQLETQDHAVELWSELSELIGSADGKKLRTFAQSITLDALVEQANHHLIELRPRYELRRSAHTSMELEIIDRDMGDEVRTVSSLSGGETFLTSLALALGLSDMSARSVRIESLFVDEGFGTLDPESLDLALNILDQLQASGRTVAVVSHVPEVAERIGFEVRVRPEAPGRSTVKVRIT